MTDEPRRSRSEGVDQRKYMTVSGKINGQEFFLLWETQTKN